MTNGFGGEEIVGHWPTEEDVETNWDEARERGFRVEVDHMANFNLAIDDALSRWNLDGDRPAKLTLRVRVRRVNPGWILQYEAGITPGS